MKVPCRAAFAACMVGVLLVAGTESLAAQNCWRGRPAPACRSFWITESGPRFGSREAFGSGVGSVSALGVMINQGARSAWGGALELSTGNESGTYRVVVLPRFRRWMGRYAIDAAVGVAILGERDPPVGFKGVTGMLAVNVADWVAIVGEVEQRRGVATPVSATLGVRFASYAGPPAALVTALVGVLAALGAGQ